mgnify:CR=1 FL=1
MADLRARDGLQQFGVLDEAVEIEHLLDRGTPALVRGPLDDLVTTHERDLEVLDLQLEALQRNPGLALRRRIPRFNGGLFADPTALPALEKDQQPR